jgi:hypothetical protein
MVLPNIIHTTKSIVHNGVGIARTPVSGGGVAFAKG